MIKNINNNTFFSYGKICSQGFKKVCAGIGIPSEGIAQLNLTSRSVNTMVCTPNSPTVIELQEGLALLFVSKDISNEQFEAFLLDRTVIINNGIYYNIVPLYSVCSILIGKFNHAEIREYQLKNEITNFYILTEFNINKVYTLFYQEKEKGFLFKGEKHNFWELTYVDKGTLYSMVDGNEFTIEPGKFMFYGENQYHTQYSKDEGVAFITITFDMDYEDSSMLCNKVFTADDEIVKILRKIMSENEDRLLGSNDIILCYLKILVIRLLRNHGLESTITNSNSIVKSRLENTLVSKAADFIETNIGKKLSVSEIASVVHLSPSYLSAIFKKGMNMTVVDYVNNCRLEESKRLLGDNSLTITEVAGMLGYTSIHYFSRQFKAHYGISPTSYRLKNI